MAVEERVEEFEHVVGSDVLVLVELEHLERLVLVWLVGLLGELRNLVHFGKVDS